MFGSDTLDAAALGAAAALLGGIVAGLFSLITAWMGNKSKRAEMAFEKRLDAFSKIVEIMTTLEDIRVSVIYHRHLVKEYMDEYGCDTEEEVDEEVINMHRNSVSQFYAQMDILINAYYKYSIFLPKHIESEVKKYQDQYHAPILSRYNTAKLVDEILSKKPTTKVISSMREYIGLK